VLFEWFTFAKDELFFEPDNPYEYSKEFFGLRSLPAAGDHEESKEADACEEVDDGLSMYVDSHAELEMLKDELHATALLRAETEDILCPICYESYSGLTDDNKRDIHIFRECLHVFCKECIADLAATHIKSGQLDKVRCPASIENSTGVSQQCGTTITERDLQLMGVSEEQIAKFTEFSIS
jgi:E3 ubiquitin-protein ligase RNF14